MSKGTEHPRTDRMRAILRYEPWLAAIETEIRNGTFEGDERQLKRRMHHLIGWFAVDPKLRSGEHYNAHRNRGE